MNGGSEQICDTPGIAPAEVDERKRLFGFGDAEARLLAACRPWAAQHAAGWVEAFYEEQLRIPAVKTLLGDADVLARLQSSLRNYILELFSGCYNEEYANGRLRIGMVHKQLGVPPKLYLPAFSLLHGLIDGALRVTSSPDVADPGACRVALRKLLMFDMELVFDTYIGHLVFELEFAREELRIYARELEKTVVELRDISRRDPLTNLLNHRAFIEELGRELARSRREGYMLSLAYIDLNGFKEVNDTHGHQRGDQVLQQIAEILVSGTRASDIVCRYGGDEFSVILPNCTMPQARQVCEKVIASMTGRDLGGVSLSVGLAGAGAGAGIDMEALIRDADTAMYRAKEESRGYGASRIVLAGKGF